MDEIIVRYEGRAKETTTIPNKPTPTGFKVWGVAQRGFLRAYRLKSVFLGHFAKKRTS